MIYMTFNSSCSYAGLANMLAHYGIHTDDRSIALAMHLPYLFSYEDGAYLAGAMLQSANWFDLFLHPIGFQMVETEVSAEKLPNFLKQQKTAMLGLHIDEKNKHAVVYQGAKDGRMVFLNNKWKDDPSAETLMLTEDDLLLRIDSSVMVATLERTAPKEIDFAPLLYTSISVLQQNLSDVQDICSQKTSVHELRSKLNPLFRPLLLDGIIMLQLLENHTLAQRFSALQRSLLDALGQNAQANILLRDYLSVAALTAATNDYIQIIKEKVEILAVNPS